MNKKQLIVTWVLLLMFLSGCGSYDEGYDDGYNGETPSFLEFSNSYKEGYEDGGDDAYYYDLGYRDAQNEGRTPLSKYRDVYGRL